MLDTPLAVLGLPAIVVGCFMLFFHCSVVMLILRECWRKEKSIKNATDKTRTLNISRLSLVRVNDLVRPKIPQYLAWSAYFAKAWIGLFRLPRKSGGRTL